MEMTSDKAGETESGKRIPVGTKVVYLGHVSGGMVRVLLANGTEHVMNPRCFKVLR